MTLLTLGQAAKTTGKQKSTILNAIKTGRLSATRDDLNQWQIDPAELFRVYDVKPQDEHDEPQLKHHETPELLAQMLKKEQEERERERVQQQATIDDLRRRLDEAEEARKDAAAETRRLTLMLTHQPAQKPKAEQIQPPSSLYEKLFGTKRA